MVSHVVNRSPSFEHELYPFTGSWREVYGLKMHVLDEGRGDTVLMLHGNPTWSFFFRNLVLGLRGAHRVIAPDHIGCGLSDKPDEHSYEYTLRRRVDDLAALIGQLQVRGRITLLMHDWGGMIGMAYAARFPEKINRLILLNTAAFHLPKSKKLPATLWLCRKTPLGELIIRDTGLFTSVLARWAVCKQMEQRVREAYLWPYRLPEDRTGLLRFVQDIPMRPGDPSYDLVSEVQERLPRFNELPSLILWGEKDFVFDHHFLSEWQRFLPAAEVHCFPNAGHYVLEDAGAEILPLIQSFLERHPDHA
ncbi:MAG: alpha/beta hydrolase [Betaproteobacteria bacterium RIFCSPLOWO2_02_FULL_62_17]|nr:MAG: alpha/beta hydrolase [Betaproteobacteria bacterium RIFCSPLOWO2_02_FULL_62_17]